jgi:hypothetical protein
VIEMDARMQPRDRLLEARQRLTAYFHLKLLAENMQSEPTSDARQLDLVNRLFEEYGSERGIVIDLDLHSKIDLDVIVKNVDYLDFHIKLVCISVNNVDKFLADLWKIYKAWMHSRVSAESIEHLELRRRR